MRNKYDYFVNGEKMARKDFMKELKSCCQKVLWLDTTGGWCILEFIDFDEKKFKQSMRDIENDVVVMFLEYNKTFKRKKVVV